MSRRFNKLFLIVPLLLFFVTMSHAQTEVNFTLHFETAKSLIPDSIINQLVRAADKWKEHDVLLQGHTDNIGTSLSNQRLSEQRVLEVKTILVNQGIDANRIQTQAWGEEQPISTNETKAGRAKNRRLTIQLIESEALIAARRAAEQKALSNKLLSFVDQKGTTHTIKNRSAEQVIVAKQGTRVIIPPNVFDVPEGTNVVIKVTEVYQKSDMVLYNLATVSDDKILETGGMLKIEAFANGKPVALRAGKSLGVEVPTKEINPDMQLFGAETTEEGTINWVQPQPLQTKKEIIPLEPMDWYVEQDINYSVIGQMPPYPSYKSNVGRKVDSSKVKKIRKEIKYLKKLTPDSYRNFVTKKTLTGKKKKIRKFPENPTEHRQAVQEEIDGLQNEIVREEKRISRKRSTKNYLLYVEANKKRKEWRAFKDSLNRKNAALAAKVRDFDKMKWYGNRLKHKERTEYWTSVYGMTVKEYDVMQYVDYRKEREERIYQRAIAENDTMAINLLRDDHYKRKLMKNIYQTETTQEAYIIHQKCKNELRYKVKAKALGLSVEEYLKRKVAKEDWEATMSYTFEMADLGNYINCDFFPRQLLHKELIEVKLDLLVEQKTAISTRTMMIFDRYNSVMRGYEIVNRKGYNSCSWNNIPINESVKVVSIYLDENKDMLVSIQKLRTTATLPPPVYQKMTPKTLLDALKEVDEPNIAQ